MSSAQVKIITHHVNNYMSQRNLIENVWLNGFATDIEADRAYKRIWDEAVEKIKMDAFVTDLDATSALLNALADDKEQSFIKEQFDERMYL